ncbi:hypothetical protein [Leptolyngbya sp. FACHB-261]|uniref:hypothetical protein n=1 Tax=Leptolyngbya sp. FACHB-261 TaxID=2692806 RepID=UPI001688744A|nr:hypothetical protein [Leptolyngbya sp. FACHB-261]MBD2099670.1 hypothetical protein [Leptolyngbya sp. FACHB-261]
MDELGPIFKELVEQPAAFLGGLVSGLLRLSLTEDPVRTWLDQQSDQPGFTAPPGEQNGKSSGPQSISID